MGRPRKRQFVEMSTENANLSSRAPDPTGASAVNAQPYYIQQIINSQMQLLPDATEQRSLPTLAASDNLGTAAWDFGDASGYGRINFDDANIDPVLSQAPLIVPPGSNSSSSDAGNSPEVPLGPCSCLASMYLALASLQQLLPDLVVALKTVRQAARTAATTIWCAQCGFALVDTPKPSIESFQNMMLLGTLIPVIVDAYRRLLEMIDVETDAAIAAGQTKTFRFHDYGGLCGDQQTIDESMVCIEKEMMFNAVELPPMQWRTTIRALLRVDIYGHEQAHFKHQGLKTLVAEIEHRQRARHEYLETHPDVGHVGHLDLGPFGGRHCAGDQTYGCLQILEMAKLAMDQLVIA